MNNSTPNGLKMDATVEAFRQRLVDNLWHIHGQAIQSADKHDAYMSLCYTVRDYLIERWRKTVDAQYAANPKCVCYLSAEYLLGKQLPQNLLFTDTIELARQALAAHGLDLDELVELDIEPGLGNGGLGRLAAWQPASSIPWRRSTSPRLAMGSDTSLGSSSSRLRTAGRWNSRTNGCCTGTHGNSLSRLIWWKLVFGAMWNRVRTRMGALAGGGCRNIESWASLARH